jgi:hypothetical protein
MQAKSTDNNPADRQVFVKNIVPLLIRSFMD